MTIVKTFRSKREILKELNAEKILNKHQCKGG